MQTKNSTYSYFYYIGGGLLVLTGLLSILAQLGLILPRALSIFYQISMDWVFFEFLKLLFGPGKFFEIFFLIGLFQLILGLIIIILAKKLQRPLYSSILGIGLLAPYVLVNTFGFAGEIELTLIPGGLVLIGSYLHYSSTKREEISDFDQEILLTKKIPSYSPKECTTPNDYQKWYYWGAILTLIFALSDIFAYLSIFFVYLVNLDPSIVKLLFTLPIGFFLDNLYYLFYFDSIVVLIFNAMTISYILIIVLGFFIVSKNKKVSLDQALYISSTILLIPVFSTLIGLFQPERKLGWFLGFFPSLEVGIEQSLLFSLISFIPGLILMRGYFLHKLGYIPKIKEYNDRYQRQETPATRDLYNPSLDGIIRKQAQPLPSSTRVQPINEEDDMVEEFTDERIHKIMKLKSKVSNISVNHLYELLEFPDNKSFMEWVMDLPDNVPIRIENNIVYLDQIILNKPKSRQKIVQLSRSELAKTEPRSTSPSLLSDNFIYNNYYGIATSIAFILSFFVLLIPILRVFQLEFMYIGANFYEYGGFNVQLSSYVFMDLFDQFIIGITFGITITIFLILEYLYLIPSAVSFKIVLSRSLVFSLILFSLVILITYTSIATQFYVETNEWLIYALIGLIIVFSSAILVSYGVYTRLEGRIQEWKSKPSVKEKNESIMASIRSLLNIE